MTAKDLWGDLPDADQIKTPVDMLKEQANLLGRKTGDKLLGRGKDETSETALGSSSGHYGSCIQGATYRHRSGRAWTFLVPG